MLPRYGKDLLSVNSGHISSVIAASQSIRQMCFQLLICTFTLLHTSSEQTRRLYSPKLWRFHRPFPMRYYETCDIFYSPKRNNFWLLCHAAPNDKHRHYSLDRNCKLTEKYWPNSCGKHWEHYTPDGRGINNTKRLRSEMFCDQTLHTSRNMNLRQKHRKRHLTKGFDRRFGYKGSEFRLL